MASCDDHAFGATPCQLERTVVTALPVAGVGRKIGMIRTYDAFAKNRTDPRWPLRNPGNLYWRVAIWRAIQTTFFYAGRARMRASHALKWPATYGVRITCQAVRVPAQRRFKSETPFDMKWSTLTDAVIGPLSGYLYDCFLGTRT